MTLKADLSHLPRAEPEHVEGLAPDAEPRFVQVLAEAWADASDDNKPTAMGTRFRHSDAGKCARAIAYTAAGIPASDPMDLTGVWNTSLGTLLHEQWQTALQARYPEAEVETKCQSDDFDGSGHIDAVVVSAGRTIAYELKTIGGFGYKAAVGKARRGTPAEGPKSEHLIQAALNGLAIGADEVVIGYLAKECISVNAAGGMPPLGRFAAEWTFTREQYEPLAHEEIERVSGILALLDGGELASRKIPDLGRHREIVDPSRGRWEERADGQLIDTGSYWGCNYCRYQTLCATTEPGRIPEASVVPVEVAS